MTPERIWNVPNALTLSRLPLSGLLFGCMEAGWWQLAFGLFLIASFTDAVDGWWARRFNCGTAFGRAADPLIDKVMVLGAFVFLMQAAYFPVSAWIIVVMMARELLITGLRGYIESLGMSFGADRFGKLKMILQSAWLTITFASFAFLIEDGSLPSSVRTMLQVGLWLVVAVTVLSGVQYLVRAGRLLRVSGA